MELQQRRWLENHGSSQDVARAEKLRPEAKQESIKCQKIGRTPARSVNDNELLIHWQTVSDNGPSTARTW